MALSDFFGSGITTSRTTSASPLNYSYNGPATVNGQSTYGGLVDYSSGTPQINSSIFGSSSTSPVSPTTTSSTPTPTGLSNQQTGLFGLSNNTWNNMLGLGQVGVGLANAYLGFQNYNLARDQFNYQKDLANRNLENQAKIINNTYDNAARVSAALGGESSEDATRRAQSQHVSGSI